MITNTIFGIFFTFSFIAFGVFPLLMDMHQTIFSIIAVSIISANFVYAKKTFTLFHLFLATLSLFIIASAISNKLEYKTYSYLGIFFCFCSALVINHFHQMEIKSSLSILALFLLVICFSSLFIQYHQITKSTVNFHPWMHHVSGNRTQANMGQPNILASVYLTSLTILLWCVRESILSKLSLLLFTIPICLGIASTSSRTAYLSLIIISIILFLIKTNNKWERYFFPAIIFICFIFHNFLLTNFSSNRAIFEDIPNGRIDIWLVGLEAIKKDFFSGYGFNETGRATLSVTETISYPNTFTAQIHNLLLDFILWFGLPLGATISLLILYITFKVFKTSIRNNYAYPLLAFLPLFIHSQLEFPLYFTNVLILFSIICGILSKKFSPDFTLKIQLNLDKKKSLLITAIFFSTSFLLLSDTVKIISYYSDVISQDKTQHKEEYSGKNAYILHLYSKYIFYLAKTPGNIWNPEEISDLEELLMYFSSPKLYFNVIKYHQQHSDEKIYLHWRKKAIVTLSKDYSKIIENTFPVD